MNKTAENTWLQAAAGAVRSASFNSPLLAAIELALVSGGITKFGWKPLIETLRTLGRPLAKPVFGMSPEAYNRAIDEIKGDSLDPVTGLPDTEIKDIAPWIVGGLLGLGQIGASYREDQPWHGLKSFIRQTPKYTSNSAVPKYKQPTNSKPGSMVKDGSLGINQWYAPSFDYSTRVNGYNTLEMFNDTHLSNDPYARNMGTAIIANSMKQSNSANPTLGDIYDSASDKFKSKLSLGGLSSVATKTIVSNAMSNMFVNAIGMVSDLSPSTRQMLVDTGTWAGAISAILD